MARKKYSEKPFQIGNRRFEVQYRTASSAKYEQKVNESINQYYRRLAKQANQRMVRLEQISTPGSEKYDPLFKGVKKYAYSKFEYEAMKFSGGKSKRFNEGLNQQLNEVELQNRINVIKQFLQSPTSTKGDIIQMYKKRADSINKAWGTDFDWQSLAKFFEKDIYDNLVSSFESDGAFMTIASMMKKKDEIIDAVKKGDDKVKIYDEDAIVNQNIHEFIASNGKDILDFFS